MYEPDKNKHSNIALHDMPWKTMATKAAGEDDALDADTVGWMQARYADGKARRAMWEQRAAQQLAWVAGHQQLTWDMVGREYTEWSIPHLPLEYREPISENRLLAVVLQKMAMLLGKPPTWHCRPFSSEDGDVSAAELGQKLLNYQWMAGPQAVASKIVRAFWVLFGTGVVWPKATWNSWGGEKIGEEGNPGAPGPSAGKKATGNSPGKPSDHVGITQLEFATGFEVTEPYGTTTIFDAPWIIHSYWMSLEELRAKYSNTDEVMPDQRVGEDDWHHLLLSASGESMAADTPAEEALVHELWRPQSAMCEKGILAITAGNVLLHRGPNPYDHGFLPFSELRELPDPVFRPACTVGNLMDLQHLRNKNLSQRASHSNQTIAPKYFTEEGSGVDETQFQEGMSTLVTCNAGFLDKTRPMIAAPLPAEAVQIGQEFKQAIDDVSGIHASTQGKQAGGVDSGRHVALLQRQDMQATAATREQLRRGFAFAGKLCLHTWFQFVHSEYALLITNDDGENEILQFRGGDLYPQVKGRPDHPSGAYDFDVLMDLQTEPDMEAAMGKIELFAKLGFLEPGNPEHRATILKLLGEQVMFMPDPSAEHRAMAREEHRRLLAGKFDQVRAAIGDDDDIHLLEHLRFSAHNRGFRDKERTDRAFSAEFRRHVWEHYYNKAEKQLRPAAMAAEAKERISGEIAMDKAKRAEVLGVGGVPMGGGPPMAGPGPGVMPGGVPMAPPVASPVAPPGMIPPGPPMTGQVAIPGGPPMPGGPPIPGGPVRMP